MSALGLLCAGFLLACLTLEGLLRVNETTPFWKVLPVISPILGQPDPDLGYALTPGMAGVWTLENRAPVTVNALGLRDRETSREKPPGTFRVGLTGDSITEALQVTQEETFAHLLEEGQTPDGKKLEVLNLAMSGNGPLRQLLRLQKTGLPLDLDMAVAIFSSSDFLSQELENDQAFPAYVEDGRGGLTLGMAFRQRFSQRQRDSFLGQLFLASIQQSRVASMAYQRLRLPLWQPPSPSAVRTQPVSPCETEKWSLLTRMETLWLRHDPPRLWTRTARFLDDHGAVLKEKGISGLLVFTGVPHPGPENGCQEWETRRKTLVETMRAEVEKRSLRFLDLEGALMETMGSAGEVGTLYGFALTPGYGHLNQKGHRVFARVLADHLFAPAARMP